MAINKETVQKLAHLSRLELDDQSQEKMVVELGGILDWVAKLEEVDTTHVAPLGNVNEESIVLRDDVVFNYYQESGKDPLKNAPAQDHDSGHYIVPKVLS